MVDIAESRDMSVNTTVTDNHYLNSLSPLQCRRAWWERTSTHQAYTGMHLSTGSHPARLYLAAAIRRWNVGLRQSFSILAFADCKAESITRGAWRAQRILYIRASLSRTNTSTPCNRATSLRQPFERMQRKAIFARVRRQAWGCVRGRTMQFLR